MTKKRKKNIASVIFVLATAGIVSACAFAGLFNFWQLKLGDLLRSARMVSDDIVIVAIDEATISETDGLGFIGNWNYDNFTQVLKYINKYSPRLVAFDFYFKNEREAESAVTFRDALSKRGGSVIYTRMNPSINDEKGYFVQANNDIPNPLPLELFRSLANVTVSSSSILPDGDNIYRRIMPFIMDEQSGEYYENFPFAIARIFLSAGPKPETPAITPGRYDINQTTSIPLENGQMIINYVSTPQSNTYKRIPFIDVYNNNFSAYGSPESLFKDKIVLIGPSASSFLDNWLTPTSGEKFMNGIEIHANAIQTILDRAFLRNLTPLEQYGLIFLLCLASVFVFMYTKIRWSLLYLVIVPTCYFFSAPFAFKQGLILDLIHPYLALVVAFIAVYVYRYVTEFREKIALRGAFGKYVNPQLVEQITQHPEQLKLGGEKRTITVLFTDIAHFTTISEKLTPESTVALINEYLEAMSLVILEEGGTLDKYEGDAIMAFFGAPLVQPDHAARAARAALKMRQKLIELMKKWQTDAPLPGGEKKPIIDFRCGISTGDAIVGNIGFTQKLEYTAMGDIVNLGSRLENANKKYGTNIMASEATYELVKDLIVARVLDVIMVMGKTKPIKVYEILAEKGNEQPGANELLKLYGEGIDLYFTRKFAEGLAKFEEILKMYPDDGPSKLYRQRCEVLRDFPPPPDWDGVFEMGEK